MAMNFSAANLQKVKETEHLWVTRALVSLPPPCPFLLLFDYLSWGSGLGGEGMESELH